MSIKQWATAMLGGNPHVVITHNPDGSKTVTDHPTKKAALDHGKALRSSGKPATFIYSKDNSEQFGLDPRYKGPTGDAWVEAKKKKG